MSVQIRLSGFFSSRFLPGVCKDPRAEDWQGKILLAANVTPDKKKVKMKTKKKLTLFFEKTLKPYFYPDHSFLLWQPNPGQDAEGQVRRVWIHIQVPSPAK